MRAIHLKSSASQKVIRDEKELTLKELEDVPKGAIPGEWVMLCDQSRNQYYLGYINAYVENYYAVKIIKKLSKPYLDSDNESDIAIKTIQELIVKSIEKRKLFINYQEGHRLVFGGADQLLGLVVDKYKKYIFIQINTAGIDRFRNEILALFERLFPEHQCLFFDNKEYRKNEQLPHFSDFSLKEDLLVNENGLEYFINRKVFQKIGFYYDHRENREKLREKLKKLNIKKETGLDLFSYVGSWGLHLLSAGVNLVEFVDQGDLEQSIVKNLELNQFQGRGRFIRDDVFSFLDKKIAEGKSYDVVVSDPPAFAKSEKSKPNALLGYLKLHQRSLRLVNDNGLFVAASCTHYVSLEELDKTVQESAIKNNQKLQLLDIGLQGHDHPMKGLKDKSFYIKYLLYLVQQEARDNL